MADLGEVVSRILSECEELPPATLREAAERIDDVAAPLLFRLGEETAGPELVEAVALLGRGRESLDEALQLIDGAVTTLRSYCAMQLAGQASAGHVTVSPAKVNEPQERQVDRIRRELPSPVERSRTVGKWVDQSGREHDLRSGEEDGWFEEAAKFAREQRMIPPFGKPLLARHVEIKFAMRMRRNNLTRETIVIDRPPCGQVDPAPLTCHAKLAEFLPPEAELTIVDRGGSVHVYRGKDEE